MKKNTILMILSFLVFIIIYLIICKILELSFENMNELYKAMISGGLTAIFSPRFNSSKTQTGDKIQLNWIVFRRLINLNF